MENYEANLTASLNVNLREALAVTPLAQEKYGCTEVLLNVPYALVPVECFKENDAERIYRLNFHGKDGDRVFYDVAGAMGAVFVYGIDEAFCRVVDENFPMVYFRSAVSSVAGRFAEEAQVLRKPRLYTYRHEDVTDIFVFRDGRLQLGNRYATHSVDDTVYFVMLAANVLGMDVYADEFVIADVQGGSKLAERLKSFIRNVKETDWNLSFRNSDSDGADCRLPYDLAVCLMQAY